MTMRVLLIDDEEDVRYVLQISLGRIGGMTVSEATSGEEGVEKARNEQPDFILLDLMMPGMDGAATFRVLQADNRTSKIPVIFLTAKAMANDVQRLRDLGARGVILKPFDPLTLAGELARIIER